MSNLLLRKFSLFADVASGTVPLTSNIILLSSSGIGPENCGVYFKDYRAAAGGDDGRVITARRGAVWADLGNDDTGSPVDHTGEWTSDTVTESDFEIACTSEDTGAWNFSHAAVGVYTALSTRDMEWRVWRVGGKGRVAGTTRCVATFRIREVADTSNFDDFTVDATATQT